MRAPHRASRGTFRPRRLRAAIAPVVIVALAVTGCGSSSSSSSSTTTAGPAPAGSVSARDGTFTTIIPAGFANRSSALAGAPITLLYAAVAPKVDGFHSNINVVGESSQGLSDPEVVAQQEIKNLKTAAPHTHAFSGIRPVTLDGAPARSVDYLNVVGTRPIHQLQVFAVHKSRIYTVTYTALSSRYASSLPAMQQVLAAWRWK
jgi:hypothetical protein